MTYKKQSITTGFLALAFLVTGIATASASESTNAPKNRISIDRARATAKKRFNGEVKGEELEFEGGKWIYSFDLSKAGQPGVQEVQVDAVTGKIVSEKHESPSDEAKEAGEHE